MFLRHSFVLCLCDQIIVVYSDICYREYSHDTTFFQLCSHLVAVRNEALPSNFNKPFPAHYKTHYLKITTLINSSSFNPLQITQKAYPFYKTVGNIIYIQIYNANYARPLNASLQQPSPTPSYLKSLAHDKTFASYISLDFHIFIHSFAFLSILQSKQSCYINFSFLITCLSLQTKLQPS